MLDRNHKYFKQAELMIRALPYIAKESCFALKGGTAINFFLYNMPRLSVDIDLTYLPLEPRDVSLQKISGALSHIASSIRTSNKKIRVQERRQDTRINKLFVTEGNIQIKIEPNELLRGALFEPQEMSLCSAAEKAFEMSVSIPVLSLPDVYAGKLCAGLDRQHPRDVFDIKNLMENEGITDNIRKAFVVYLSCGDRPIHELIDPKRLDMKEIFDREFVGMTLTAVTYAELIQAREKYIEILKTSLSENEKSFLLSLKSGNPEWDLLGIKNLEKLPALQWKLLNIRKMNKIKQAEYFEKLKRKLG